MSGDNRQCMRATPVLAHKSAQSIHAREPRKHDRIVLRVVWCERGTAALVSQGPVLTRPGARKSIRRPGRGGGQGTLAGEGRPHRGYYLCRDLDIASHLIPQINWPTRDVARLPENLFSRSMIMNAIDFNKW